MTTTIDLPWPKLDRVFLVGLGHQARQGKDLAADAIVAAFGTDARRFACADAVRALARVEYRMTAKDAPLLQQIGVGRRSTDPDIWVRTVAWAIADWVADRQGRPGLAVIPDVRFPNEAQFVRQHQGLLIRVLRYGPDGQRVVATDRPATHISETSLYASDFTATLDNVQGRPELLQQRAVQLVQTHFWAWTESL
jgi:hypothetical protein